MQRLLNLLAVGQPQTIPTLAARLNLSEGIIRLMMAQLAQMGYLQESGACDDLATSGSAACNGCGAACLVSNPQHIWTLTAKGRMAARTGDKA